MNLLNGPMDHGWCLGYTCQERISTFYGIVASNRNYSLYFTSTSPQKMRLHLLGEKNQVIRFAIYYKTTQRLDIYRKGGRISYVWLSCFNFPLQSVTCISFLTSQNYSDNALKV